MTDSRTDYSPITDRADLKAPHGKRLIVWIALNIENWDINSRMARAVLPTPQGVDFTPDVPNYAWHEYGMRVGFWRIREVLDKHGVRASVPLNASVCEDYPQVVTAMVESNYEMMGHGYVQRVLPLEGDERAVVRKTIDTIRDFTGTAPRGWLGPGLAETFDTLDILASEGIEWVGDWVADDQPYPLKVESGELTSIPYTVEMNDIPMYVVQHHQSQEIFERGKAQFDTLYREGADSARVMCIAIHPYVTGVPHRIGYFDALIEYIKFHEGVVFMTGSEILDWYKSAK